MKTQLHVLVPASTNPLQLQDAVQTLPALHRQAHNDTIQPNWRSDYLCLFDPTLNCAETDAELPYEIRDDFASYISRVHRLRLDAIAGAVVTPDGRWHDMHDFGYRMMNDAESNAAAETVSRTPSASIRRTLGSWSQVQVPPQTGWASRGPLLRMGRRADATISR